MYMYYVYEVKVVDSDPKDVYFITFKGYKQTNFVLYIGKLKF